MGPIRRRIALFCALCPAPAWAEVCDKVRPMWTGEPATAFGEAVALFATVPSLVLILITVLVLRFRHAWGGAAVTVLWSLLIMALVLRSPSEIEQQALAEGCIGSPTLFIAAVIAICAAVILYTAPNRAPSTDGDP